MKAIVLAAGKGKRLQSEAFNQPKVLRLAVGEPLIGHVLKNTDFIAQEDTIIVVGYKKEMVIDYVKGQYKFASQDEQLGTGHAVMMAEEILKDYDGDVLVLYGDMPLFSKETLESFIETHKKLNSVCTVMTGIVDNPPAYGRIVRNSEGDFVDIVETKDCNEEQLKIKELNVGVYVFDCKTLFNNLRKLNNNNNQKEYYLTDIPKILLSENIKVNTYTVSNSEEIYGVNTLEELEFCENILRRRANI